MNLCSFCCSVAYVSWALDKSDICYGISQWLVHVADGGSHLKSQPLTAFNPTLCVFDFISTNRGNKAAIDVRHNNLGTFRTLYTLTEAGFAICHGTNVPHVLPEGPPKYGAFLIYNVGHSAPVHVKNEAVWLSSNIVGGINESLLSRAGLLLR